MKKEPTKKEQDEIDRNWYKNVKILSPVGKPSVPRSQIRKAVQAVMREDGMLPAKQKKN